MENSPLGLKITHLQKEIDHERKQPIQQYDKQTENHLGNRLHCRFYHFFLRRFFL